LHRIIPEFILENFRANRYRGTFDAASLFIDISGFSTMVDVLFQHGQHGSEVLAGMMRAVFDPVVDAIFGHRGIIVGYAGDSLTALYPYESDSYSAARHALAAAYGIQQGLLTKPLFTTPYGAFQISARIGLAIGSVSWGILQSQNGEKATYYFRGDAVEEASQAEHLARPGEIILTRKIFEQLTSDMKAEPVDPYYRLSSVSDRLPSAAPIELPPVDTEIANTFALHPIIVQGVRNEFRQTVHLFMRIPDPEAEQLEHFMHVLFDLQDRYGGVIDRIDFGDKGCNMIVVWGAPIAYENDIGRALNFVIRLKSQAPFPITAGLTYYISHAGYVGGQLFENFTCYGWGINLAARFMMNAPDGEVWLDERAVQRVKRRFWFDFVGEQNFKGFAQKQKVYVLKGRKSETDDFFQGEMIGREQELEKLADFISPLWSGQFAGLLAVWGEAGIGKSRLIHEFMHSALFRERRILWALCQSDQILRQSFNPFRYWLVHYFNLLPGDDQTTGLQKFFNKLEDLIDATADDALAQELRRTSSFLAALVDLNWTDSSYEQLDAQGRYDNTILALISLIKAESLRQPLILFIEDIHYLDEDSKKFIPRLKRALLSETTSYPIAVLTTTRWQGTDVLIEQDLIDQDLDLAGLSSNAFLQLAKEILGQPAAPALVHLVAERADGNPFFAEQILRYLQDESLLESSEAGLTLTKTRNISLLPTDINKMLIARLDQLTHQLKDVIHAASILGREFEVQVLARMLQEDSRLNDEIVEAEQARVWSPLSQIRYIFNHSLLRDVAYNMQLQARRQELHALAFRSLEELYHSEVQYHYGELAYHSEQALLEAEARFYLQIAGDTARDTYQNSDAIDYYSRAFAFISSAQPLENYNLLLERAAVYGRLGDRDSQVTDLDAAHELAAQLGNDYLARTNLLRAEYFYTIGNFADSIHFVENVADHLDQVQESESLLGIYITWCNSLLRSGRSEEALRRANEGLKQMRRAGKTLDEGRMLSSMGLVALEQNDSGAARRYLEQALEIARKLENLELQGKVLNNLANAAGFIEGDFTLARDYYEQAYTKVHQRGDRYGEGLIILNLGWCAGMQGDFKVAGTYLKQALSISREVGNSYQEAYTLFNLSAVSGIRGESESALLYASQALEMSIKINDLTSQAWSYLNLGHANLLAGDLQKAEQAYQEAIRIRKELKQPGLTLEPLAGLIQVALQLNNLEAAMNQTENILEYLAAGGSLDGAEEPLRIYFACYSALEKSKDPRTSDILATAIHLLDAQVSRFHDETARRMYVENVPWRLAIQKAWEALSSSGS